MKITTFLLRLKKIRHTFRWTNQQSKSCGIGQKKYSAPLAATKTKRAPANISQAFLGNIQLDHKIVREFSHLDRW